MSPVLTRQDFCRFVTQRMVVRSKGRMSTLRLAKKNRPPSTPRLLALHSSIRGLGKQCTHQDRPRVPWRYPPSWHPPQVVNLRFRGELYRKCMVHDVGISGRVCILV